MINWLEVEPLPAKGAVIASLRTVITKSKYGFGLGQWNMTELIQSNDIRRDHAYQIIDGINHELKRESSMGLRMDFRLKVHTRQACCRTGEGKKIWERVEALENLGGPGDITAEYTDLPEPGDVVEWKGAAKQADEFGKVVDSKTIKRWAMQGIRAEEYEEFVVDEDGCISVYYPFVLAMLTRKGKRLAYPQFRKIDKASKRKRRITNWWFEEFPQNYTEKKSTVKKSKDSGAMVFISQNEVK